jgi:cytochrome P450
VDKVIARQMERRQQGGERSSRDLLSLLLNEQERNPSFTAGDVHDEITTFLFATFENYTVLSNALL